MSNNIYDILGKINALTPKEEPVAQPKQIYESVEARGSVLEGVKSVQAKLEAKLAEHKQGAVDEMIDMDTLNQLASHPMAGPMAAAGGAAIGAAVGKGIKKLAGAHKYFGSNQKKPADKKMAEASLNLPLDQQHDIFASHDDEVDDIGMASDAPQWKGYNDRKKAEKEKRKEREVAEEVCNECGMYESECGCEHEHEDHVNEKAVSKAQQKFMGMVHAAQKGEKAASPAVAKAAKGMTKKAATDYAGTKHKGLPQHVKESKMNVSKALMESVNFKTICPTVYVTSCIYIIT